MTPRTLAAFDFDHTLIKGDSFWPFLELVAGWPTTIMALSQALALFGLRHLRQKQDAADGELRTFVKSQLLQRVLKGRRPETFAPSLEKLRAWQEWNAPMRQTLIDHHAAGHHVVIISGALDLYLPALVAELPHHAVICTRVGVENGVITGTMPDGNCVRQRKAELLQHYIAAYGPFEESWGYGNYPHDVPMMNLLKHRVIV